MTSARGWSERHGLWRSAPVQHTVYRTTISYNTGGRHGLRRESPPRRCPCQQLSMQTALATNARTQGPNSVLHARTHAQRQSCAHASDTHAHAMHANAVRVVTLHLHRSLASARSASKCIPRCAMLGACSRPLPCCAVQAPAPARPSVDPDGQANAPHARGCKCDTCLRAKWSAIQQALGPTLGTHPAACNVTVSDEETEAAAKRKWAVPRAGAGAVRPQPQQRRATETGTIGLQASAAAARDVAPPPRRHTSYAVERAAAAVQPAGGRPVVAAKAREVGGPSTRQNFDKRSAVRLC
jgi:hypothetical protein